MGDGPVRGSGRLGVGLRVILHGGLGVARVSQSPHRGTGRELPLS
ncbi:hypothetical protein [Streptomyces virginiae]